MKMRYLFLFAVCLLAACTPSPEVYVTPTPDFSATDTANQIATVVAEKATAVALITPTPSPKPVTLEELLLNSAEINELANRWSDTPFIDTASVTPELCRLECVLMNWEGGPTGASYLELMLVKTGSRDEASTYIDQVRDNVIAAGAGTEVTLPDLITFPEGTVAMDLPSGNKPEWSLLTRYGDIAISVALNLPDLSDEENLLFLTLYADRQIQKLTAAGN